MEKSKQNENVGAPSWPKAPGVTEGEETLLFECRSLLDKAKGAESGKEIHDIELEIRKNRRFYF